MQQRINWTGYLLIGIISFLAAAVAGSCRVRTEYRAVGDYVLINETDHTIRLGNEISIPPKGQYAKENISFGSGKDIQPQYYLALPQLPDFENIRTYVVFDEVRCGEDLNEYNPDGLNIRKGYYDIKNYTYEKIENRHYRFTYRFTEQDYTASTPCTQPTPTPAGTP